SKLIPLHRSLCTDHRSQIKTIHTEPRLMSSVWRLMSQNHIPFKLMPSCPEQWCQPDLTHGCTSSLKNFKELYCVLAQFTLMSLSFKAKGCSKAKRRSG